MMLNNSTCAWIHTNKRVFLTLKFAKRFQNQWRFVFKYVEIVVQNLSEQTINPEYAKNGSVIHGISINAKDKLIWNGSYEKLQRFVEEALAISDGI